MESTKQTVENVNDVLRLFGKPTKGRLVKYNGRVHEVSRVWSDGRFKVMDKQYPRMFAMLRWK